MLLVIAILSLMLFIRKRMASKDPRAMARYYAKQQRSRERRHELVEKLPLSRMIEGLSLSTGSNKPSPSNLPAPSRPGPVMSRPGLPPMPASVQTTTNLRAPYPNTPRMPPPPPHQINRR
jgi:hypothetical protein